MLLFCLPLPAFLQLIVELGQFQTNKSKQCAGVFDQSFFCSSNYNIHFKIKYSSEKKENKNKKACPSNQKIVYFSVEPQTTTSCSSNALGARRWPCIGAISCSWSPCSSRHTCARSRRAESTDPSRSLVRRAAPQSGRACGP